MAPSSAPRRLPARLPLVWIAALGLVLLTSSLVVFVVDTATYFGRPHAHDARVVLSNVAPATVEAATPANDSTAASAAVDSVSSREEGAKAVAAEPLRVEDAESPPPVSPTSPAREFPLAETLLAPDFDASAYTLEAYELLDEPPDPPKQQLRISTRAVSRPHTQPTPSGDAPTSTLAMAEQHAAVADPESLLDGQQVQEQQSPLHASEFEAPPTQSVLPRGGLGECNCVAWRETRDCSPDGGPSEPNRDASCHARIAGGRAGYCLFQNRHTGETKKLLAMHCDSLSSDASFKCSFAPEVLQYGDRALEYSHDADLARPSSNGDAAVGPSGVRTLPRASQERGITMVVHARVLTSAYAAIRTLRDVGCELPVEIWFRADELAVDHALLTDLATSYGAVVREIRDPRATSYFTKLYAVFHSAFDQVLLLDADNFAVRDPTYLFETEAFTETGAVFWPDYWTPRNTIFNVHERSALWEILGIAFVDMFEQESGQVLIDRRRHAKALHVLMYYGFYEPRVLEYLELVWGDKDLFRLAWMKTNSAFHMIERPAGSAGRLNTATNQFCGLTMVQHDPHGEIVFLHRNAVKLSEQNVNIQLWTHVQQFKRGHDRSKYVIEQCTKGFANIDCCWGRQNPGDEDFTLTPLAVFTFRDLERRLLELVDEAGKVVFQGIHPS